MLCPPGRVWSDVMPPHPVRGAGALRSPLGGGRLTDKTDGPRASLRRRGQRLADGRVRTALGLHRVSPTHRTRRRAWFRRIGSRPPIPRVVRGRNGGSRYRWARSANASSRTESAGRWSIVHSSTARRSIGMPARPCLLCSEITARSACRSISCFDNARPTAPDTSSGSLIPRSHSVRGSVVHGICCLRKGRSRRRSEGRCTVVSARLGCLRPSGSIT